MLRWRALRRVQAALLSEISCACDEGESTSSMAWRRCGCWENSALASVQRCLASADKYRKYGYCNIGIKRM